MLAWVVTARGGLSESVTCAVKLEVPVAVGMPEMTPVPTPRPSPVGREPAVINQEYGATPPAAERVAS